ncbi:Peptidase M24A, methionine aminopeptidase, subfamily 1 [Candidatus Omnitrophus magneticus]|uniref:Methionine aminopeptidase n=1 Tax=Candidatus Omnitrophus magneticus TaxID=1609969 RepID=A0A0F0CQQ8_9BACT|nr:Peptidase M24A, methionine aminopeptidase, subfamily 1 [Candidatus Omnitrophus magneticus]
MTLVTDEAAIDKLRSSGQVIKKIFKWVEANIEENISTGQLDKFIEELIIKDGAIPAFKGYKGYPATICISMNNEVIHGIPNKKRIIKKGDIVSIDVGVLKNGYFTDAARTYTIGSVESNVSRLIKVTKKSLEEGIKKAVTGSKISDISKAIEKIIRKEKFEEIRDYVGHGVGRELHEEPEVPNWYNKNMDDEILQQGLVLAIEPMVVMGKREVKILDDRWTVVTKDGSLACHFEDTIIVGKGKAEIVT